MAYASLTDVQSLNPKRTYSATSTPSSTQVEALINLIYGQINNVLSSQGYIVPVTTPSELVTALQLLNAAGAAAMAEMGMFPETSDKGSTPHWKALWEMYQDGLESLRKGEIPAGLGKISEELAAGSLYTSGAIESDHYPEPVFRISGSDKEF